MGFRESVAQVATTSGRPTLSTVRRGKRRTPDRVLLAGVEGVGKTTFAADAPAPVFIAGEDGITEMDVASFPEPRAFADVLECVRVLTEDEHDYKTLVIDTLDWIEPLVWRALCDRNGWDNIESPGFGKGYNLSVDVWRELVVALENLQAKRGMDVILLAHTQIKTFSNPAGNDYSRYEIKLHRLASALWREWTKANLFAIHEEYTKKEKGETKVKAVSTGMRVIHTQRTAAWDAKNRYGLPEELPLSYAEYAAARDAGQPGDPAKLETEARSLVVQIKDEAKRGQIETYINESSGDAIKLAKAVDRLRNLVAEAA